MPSRIRRGYIDTPEGQIHYRTAGEGEPLVLLHRTALSSAFFESVLPLFAAKGRTAVAFDTPGFGASDPPPEPPNMTYYAKRMVEAAALLGFDQFDLLGNHTGATIAARMAADFPSNVRHLVLWGYPMMAPEDMARVRRAEPVEFPPDGSYVPNSWRPPATGPIAPPVLSIRFLLERLQAGPNAYWAPRAVGNEDHAALARRITTPTLIISHQGDPCLEGSQNAEALIPNSRYVPIEGIDMDVPNEALERFVDTVDSFLQEPTA
jgi:pimeloyl-ACP methyl ester carboxylesterase